MEGASVVHHLLLFSVIFLAVTISFCLLRGILGPRFTDRMVAVNLIGIKTVLLIAALSLFLEKPYLLDICLVYSIISFLAIAALNNSYLFFFNRRQAVKNSGEKTEGEVPYD